MTRYRLNTGLDRLLADDVRMRELRGARVGLLGHPASVTRRWEHALDALLNSGVRPVRLFGPEHGLRGEAQDMIAVDQAVDPISGIPTVSLYGSTFASLTPRPDDLVDLDVMLVDLQDVGARYYTYVYTAMLAAEACADAGVRCLVLDRPNPIGGATEGGTVLRGFESFVGMLPLPARHGLTTAEVLRLAQQRGRHIDAEIIEIDGWHHGMWFDDTDAPWVLPSPNLPTYDSALVYPGMCLLEGTNLSEGRGTTRPFELFGAPWVDACALREELMSLGVPGAVLRLASFEPTFQKWGRQRCSGLQVHVVDRALFEPVRFGAAVLWACRQLFDGAFAWRRDAYEFVDDIPAIDLLFGSDAARRAIDDGAPFSAIESLLAIPDDVAKAVEGARLASYAP